MGEKSGFDQRDLEVVIEVTPREDCPVRTLNGTISQILHHPSRDGIQCKLYVDDESGQATRVIHKNGGGSKQCVATICEKFDCIPEVIDVRADSMVIATHPPSANMVRELISKIQSVSQNVNIIRVSEKIEFREGKSRHVDLDKLTEKQCKALEMAAIEGYFSNPKEITIEELANKCHITQSAMSKRLLRAENQIINQLFGEHS